MEQVIGYTIGEANVLYAHALVSKARMGTYVILSYDEGEVLGLITSVVRGSRLIGDDFSDLETLGKIREFDNAKTTYMKANIRLIMDLSKGTTPDTPPPPGTPVKLAGDDVLRNLLQDSNDATITIGNLIGNEDVPVNINIRYLASRHLAILAATGSGKSNTVAVLSSGIAEIGGCIVIYDYHGEYINSDIREKHVIQPFINPLYLTSSEIAELMNIRENATNQQRVLRKAIKSLRGNIEKGVDSNSEFTQLLSDAIEAKGERSEKGYGEDKKAITDLLNKIEDFEDRYAYILRWDAPPVTSNLMLGRVNIVNLEGLDDNVIDAVISHYLKNILEARKAYKHGRQGLPFPVINVIEEAHIFLSNTDNTLTKYWASRIAKEGRKFGTSLIIVSQRPKGLDPGILSQMTNKIVMKIVEPEDQKYIMSSSDNLSEDLINQLPALAVGQAIIVGMIVRIPVLAKIRKFEGVLGGADPDVMAEWSKAKEKAEENERIGREISNMGEQL
ncbi:hypothetical protein HS7_10950 [Sulfolobales archaeon HS-7]|nr:hypothetical protein HS7_10950 [Sulfolobales archaeon HS-7]